MNNDLISRDVLKKDGARIKDTGYDTNNEPLFDFVELTTLFKIIDNAPTVEPNCEGCATWVMSTELLKKRLSYLERPQGEWLHHEEYTNNRTFYITECPFCKLRVHEETNFCSNCGADMRSEENE